MGRFNKLSYPGLRLVVKTALHFTRLKENRKTLNKGEAEWQMLGQIVYLLPSLSPEKEGGKGEKEKERKENKSDSFRHGSF